MRKEFLGFGSLVSGVSLQFRYSLINADILAYSRKFDFTSYFAVNFPIEYGVFK